MSKNCIFLLRLLFVIHDADG